MVKETVHIGETLRDFLNEKGLKHIKIAEKLEMSRNGFSMMLDRPTMEYSRLKKLGEILGPEFIERVETGGGATTTFQEVDQTYTKKEKGSLHLEVDPSTGEKVVVLTFKDGELVDIQQNASMDQETFDERLNRIEEGLKRVVELQVRNMEK